MKILTPIFYKLKKQTAFIANILYFAGIAFTSKNFWFSKSNRYRNIKFLSKLVLFLLVLPFFGKAQTYTFAMNGANVSVPNSSTGVGTITVVVNTSANTMRILGNFSGLTGNVTAAHIHAITSAANIGTSGVATPTPSLVGFPIGVLAGTYDNTFDMTQSASYNPAFIAANSGTVAGAFLAVQTALTQSKAYFDIHTSTFAGGEIRAFPTTGPTLSLTADSTNVPEITPAKMVVYKVTASSAVATDQKVKVTFTGTASAADYTISGLVGDSLTIPANATTATFTLTPVDDAIFENNETVITTISGPTSGFTIGAPASHTLTIRANDTPVGFTLTTTCNLIVQSQVFSYVGTSANGYPRYITTGFFPSEINYSTGAGWFLFEQGTQIFQLSNQDSPLPPCNGTLTPLSVGAAACLGTTFALDGGCIVPIFTVATTKQDVLCSGTNNGWAKATPNQTCGAGYQYLWTPGNFTTDSIGGLAAGTYNVRVVCGTDTVNKSVTIGTGTGPAAPTTCNQSFCSGATIADLAVSGTAVQWYSAPTGGTALAPSAILVNGASYFASQTVSGCEGARTQIQVTIAGQLNPKADTSFCNANTPAGIVLSGNASNTYNWTATQNGTGIAASGTNAFIGFTPNNTGNTVKKDTVFVAANSNLPCRYILKDSSYYFADTTGSTYLTLPVNTGNISTSSNGSFPREYTNPGAFAIAGTGRVTDSIDIGFTFNFYCQNFNKLFISNVGNLILRRDGNFIDPITPSMAILGHEAGWSFDASSKISYKVSGTAPNRSFIVTYSDLKIPVNDPLTSTTYTADPANGRGTFQIVLNETANTIHTLKQHIPGVTKTVGTTTSIPNVIREGVYSLTIPFNPQSTVVPGRNSGPWVRVENDIKIFIPVPATTCTTQRDTFTVSVLPTPKVDSIGNQPVCPGSTVAAINFTTPITGGTVGYKWTNSNPAIGLAASGFGNIPSFTAAATAQTSTTTVRPYMVKTVGDTCFGTIRTFTINADLPALPLANNSLIIYTGTKTLSQLAVSGTALQYYAAATGGTALAGTTIVQDDSSYYVTQTANGCESNRARILVNRIANDSSVHCSGASINNIITSPNIGNTVKWYDSLSTATVLVGTTTLNIGQDTLYVEETGSNRVPVTVIVNPTPNVTATVDQVVCNNNSVAAVNFSTTTTGGTVTYAWTNNKPGIGIAATGSSNIASFTGVNNGAAPDTATIIVTPTVTNAGVSCVGVKDTFLIVINPTAQVNTIANQVVCNSASTAAVNFGTTNSGGTTTYAWANSNTSIGLAASGTGNIASFTATNIGTAPVTATITVSPTFTNGGVSCSGPSKSFTITVNPTATVNTVSNQVLCTGSAATAVNFSSPTTGGTIVYNWTNSNTGIGLAASGSGNIPTFIGTNTTTAPLVATITVTPTYTNAGVSCTGTARTFIITVNPVAKINAIVDNVQCNGSSVAAVTPSSTSTGGTVTYSWTNNNTAIGLAASGTGVIPGFTATNTGTSAITATVIVTPTFTANGISCVGTNDTFTITVNPSPVFNATADKTVCVGTTSAVNFSTPLTGGTAVFTWTNNNTAIGLAAGGTGNIPSFNATNAITAPIFGEIVVSMAYTNAGLTCTSLQDTFDYFVNPVSSVIAVGNQVLCNNTPTAAVNFSSPNTGGVVSYSWTNSNPGVGLAAGGSGNIAGFTATNNGDTVALAAITVTPSFSNNGVSCTGISRSFTITINPTVTVNTISNQVVCNGSAVTAVNFGTSALGGTTTYAWSNNTTSIGLAASGTGNIASFNATNIGTAPVTATITVTPTFTNGGVSCVGTARIFTITVNPTATVNAISNQVVCNGGAVAAVNFGTTASGGTTTYAWTNNTASIGLAASGTGNIASFNAVNTSTAPITATITVTPTFTNGGVSCTGTPRSFTITINPTATVTSISNKVECNGSVVAALTPSTPNVGGTITFTWVNNNTAIGLTASGTGTIPSFTATNSGTAPVTATVSITPTFTNAGVSCTGTSFSYTITVNPPPVFNAISNQAACNGSSTSVVPFSTALTGGASVFAWTNTNTAIGLAASGTGSLPSFIATNSTTAPISGTVSVVMTYTNAGLSCVSLPQTFTYVVNPTATVNAINNQTLCNRANANAINFGSTTTGGNIVYNWLNNNPSIGLAISGSGNIPVFTATNTTSLPITATITVTPIFSNAGISCTGTARAFTITVNPTPVTNFAINNPAQCFKGNQFVFTNLTTGASSYLWTLGDGNNSTSTSITKSYTTTGTFNVKLQSTNIYSCLDSITKTIIVYPQPVKPIVVPEYGNGVHSSVIANSYLWFNNNIAIANSNTQFLLPQNAGYHQVEVSSINGCKEKSDSLYYIPEVNFTAGLDVQYLFVYPLPVTNGEINIHFNLPLLHKVECSIYTDIGQFLKKVEIPAGERQFKIDVKQLPKANYVLHFNDYYNLSRGVVVPIIK